MKLRLNNRVAFGVGPDRFEQGRRIEASADVFLLDDGFQHRQLSRDVDILLIDAARSLGKEVMLPTGRLREPVSAMSRADFLLFTRTETVPGTMEAITKLQQYPVFSAATQLVGFRRLGERIQFVPADEIDAGPFYAFCGIGNPRAFFLNLQNWGIAVAGKCEFGDHHRYDERDVRELVAAARRMGARALVTTEKDEQNLSGEKFEGLPVYVAVIDLAIDKEEVFLQAIREKLDARNSVA
jgi:tetraacyldisaccharide 4'-kinase